MYIIYNTHSSGQQILAGEVEYVEGLNAVDWDEEARQNLQLAVNNSNQNIYCGGGSRDVSHHKSCQMATMMKYPLLQGQHMYSIEKFPKIECPYIPPEQCPVVTEEVTEDGVVLRASVAVLLVLSLLTAIIG